MSQSPHISVVIPFFNEEGNVIPLVEELVPLVRRLDPGFEVVAIDDGSEDGTDAELREVRRRHPAVRHLRMRENAGQTAAFEAGFRVVRGDVVVTMDGDQQIDPADIAPMYALLRDQGVDFVYGWRRNRRDNFVKRVSTRVANGVRNFLTRERIHDTGCPLKVFRREIIDRLKLYDGMHRFFITLAHMDGFRSAEMVVNHRPRRHGKSKYGVWNRMFRALRDCLVVRWMASRHLRYACEEVPASEVVPGPPVSESAASQDD